jgi:hypothetical protein
MALARGFRERVGNTGLGSQGRILGDTDLLSNRVGRQKADAANVLGESVGVFLNDLDGPLAVSLEDAHRSGSRYAMRVQEDHDAANDLLVSPAGSDLSGADFADAGNFAKAFR